MEPNGDVGEPNGDFVEPNGVVILMCTVGSGAIPKGLSLFSFRVSLKSDRRLGAPDERDDGLLALFSVDDERPENVNGMFGSRSDSLGPK